MLTCVVAPPDVAGVPPDVGGVPPVGAGTGAVVTPPAGGVATVGVVAAPAGASGLTDSGCSWRTVGSANSAKSSNCAPLALRSTPTRPADWFASANVSSRTRVEIEPSTQMLNPSSSKRTVTSVAPNTFNEFFCVWPTSSTLPLTTRRMRSHCLLSTGSATTAQ